MPLDLSGSERRDLRQALMSAFPRTTDLELVASDLFDLELGHIVSLSHDHEYVTHELIGWALSEGTAGRLILGARALKPDNQDLHRVAQMLRLTSTEAPRATLEKLVSANTSFLDVARWRTRLTQVEFQVCRVERAGAGVGTGFLVGPDLVLTNHHVLASALRDPGEASTWGFRFDYKVATTSDVVHAGTSVGLAAEWLVAASPHSAADLVPLPRDQEPGGDELDFALVRLARPMGREAPAGRGMAEPRGWVELSSERAQLEALTAIAIMQHPKAQPLKLALGFDRPLSVSPTGTRVRYEVPTLPGSSGSPVFDGDWNLVALHHSGDPDSLNPSFNEGIPAHLIARRPEVAAALSETITDF